MTSITIARPAPARRGPAPTRPPELRVVRGPATARRSLGPVALGVIAGAVLFATLLGLAAFQTVLVGSQQRLDRLDRQVAEAQAHYQALRLETARLESPGRIVAEATTRLGMVPPAETSYLSPSAAALAGTALASDPGTGTATEAATGDSGTADWAEVKPFLGDTP